MNLRKALPATETAVIWLFLLQALRVLFASLFGVIYDAIFDQTLSFFIVGLDLLLVLLATLTPLLLRRFPRQDRARVGAALLVLVARLPLSLKSPPLRLYASILLLGGAAFYVAYLLWERPERLMTGFVLGLAADQLLRAWDYTYDPTLRPEGLLWVVVIALATALVVLFRHLNPAWERPSPTATRPHPSACLALGAALFVETSLLALPNALTHWSGIGYDWTAPLLMLATLLPLSTTVRALELYLSIWLWPLEGIVSIAAILLCFVLAALLQGVVALLLLLLVQILFLLNVTTGITKKRVPRAVTPQNPGRWMSLGFLLLLALNFIFAFTFTYPYTLPFLRGLGTPVLLVAVLMGTLAIIKVPLEPEIKALDPFQSTLSLVGPLALTVICALLTGLPPLPDAPASGPLRLATYNIHYGFDGDWVFSLEEIAETIEVQAVDVIALQEVDAGRITSLSVDDGLWLSRRLGMHLVYQPTLEKLSGVALLSRYPLQENGGQWLTSQLEQTAIVYGAVETSNGPLHAFGIWLGLEPEERAAQLTDALNFIGADSPASLGGDFNATPDSSVYAHLLDAGFEDPFVALGQNPPATSPAQEPQTQIDYVWLRGLAPHRAWVADSTASDHRLVVVEVQLGER